MQYIIHQGMHVQQSGLIYGLLHLTMRRTIGPTDYIGPLTLALTLTSEDLDLDSSR